MTELVLGLAFSFSSSSTSQNPCKAKQSQANPTFFKLALQSHQLDTANVLVLSQMPRAQSPRDNADEGHPQGTWALGWTWAESYGCEQCGGSSSSVVNEADGWTNFCRSNDVTIEMNDASPFLASIPFNQPLRCWHLQCGQKTFDKSNKSKVVYIIQISYRRPSKNVRILRLSSILVSIVVSIPACHAGDQGSIPWRGDFCLLDHASMSPLHFPGLK